MIYDSKKGHGEGKNIPGFIAEEVNLIAPHLVVFNKYNQPENISYNYFHALTIKEIQKQQKLIEEQDKTILMQDSTIELLLTAIEQLEEKLAQLEEAITNEALT